MLWRLLRQDWARAGGALLLGTLTVLFSVGLLATSGALISRSAQHPETLLVLLPLITGVRMFGIGRAALRYAERLVAHDLTFRLLGRVRSAVLAGLLPLAPAALLGERGGDLLSRLRVDVDELQGTYLKLFAPALVALVVCLISLGLLWALTPALAVIMLLLYLVSGVALPAVTQRLTRRLGTALPAVRADLNSQVLSMTQGIADLLVSGAQGSAQLKLHSTLNRIELTERRRAAVAAGANVVREAVSGAGLIAALVLVGTQVAAGTTSGYLLAAAALGVLASFEAVANLGAAWAAAPEITAAAVRVERLGTMEPVVRDPAEARQVPPDPTLCWEGVTFRYPGQRHGVLEDFGLALPPQGRLALVGPSGAGKSTVLKLALRFWDPQQGRLTVGGTDIRDIALEDLRALFAWAPQQAEIFDGSLRDNLLSDAAEDEITGLLHELGLGRLLERLPGGLDGWVGEYGAQLSAGERARLSVARALLSSAPILLLDEPVAHLDPDNAHVLLDTVLRRASGRSILLVTHQPDLLGVGVWQVVPVAPD